MLVLSSPSSTDITIQVTVKEDTAKSEYTNINNILNRLVTLDGSDYGPGGPYNITIPAGQTNISFDISIIDDHVLEENKVFELIIIPPTIIELGGPNRTTVTIVDDDGK